jgi:hypothetical protein
MYTERKKINIALLFSRLGAIVLCSFIISKVITVDKHFYFLSKETVSFAHAYIDVLYMTFAEVRDGLITTKEMLFKDQAVRELNVIITEELRLSKEENSLLKHYLTQKSYDCAALQGQNDIILSSSKEINWFSTVLGLFTFCSQAYNMAYKGDISNTNFTAQDKSILNLILTTLVSYTTGTQVPQVFEEPLTIATLPTRNPTI